MTSNLNVWGPCLILTEEFGWVLRFLLLVMPNPTRVIVKASVVNSLFLVWFLMSTGYRYAEERMAETPLGFVESSPALQARDSEVTRNSREDPLSPARSRTLQEASTNEGFFADG